MNFSNCSLSTYELFQIVVYQNMNFSNCSLSTYELFQTVAYQNMNFSSCSLSNRRFDMKHMPRSQKKIALFLFPVLLDRFAALFAKNSKNFRNGTKEQNTDL